MQVQTTRKRLQAFHADSEEEFKTKMKVIAEEQSKCDPSIVVSAYRPKTNYTAKEIVALHEQQKQEAALSGFEFKSFEPTDKKKVFKRQPSIKVVDQEDDVPEEPGESSPTTKLKKMDCMVVGKKGIGKHNLINYIFRDPQEASNQNTGLDMIVKSTRSLELIKTYHFWIYHSENKSNTDLLNLYYKKASLFFLVFQLHSRESFTLLGEAAQSIQKEIPPEKFQVIVVGVVHDDGWDREVKPEEGEAFASKIGGKYLQFKLRPEENFEKLVSVLEERMSS